MASVDSTDIEISEWLDDHPEVTRIIDAPIGPTEEIDSQRLNNHVERPIRLSSPSGKQIRFESPVQFSGLGGTLVSAVLLQFFLRRAVHPALPFPNHFEPDRFREFDASGTLRIAALSHSLIAGGIDGRALTGPNFVYRFGLTFGVRVDNAHLFPNDEIIFTMDTRPRITAERWISGCRRFPMPLDSLSHYLSRTPVVFRGIGRHRDFQFKEAVLMITGVSALSTRPGRPISGLTADVSPDLSMAGSRPDRGGKLTVFL